MYRTAPKAPTLARVNLDAAHARSVGTFSVVFGVLCAIYLGVRELVPSSAPPEIADRIALLLPFVLALPLTSFSILAARTVLPEKRLPHTVTSPSALAALLVFFTVGVLFFVLLLWTIAPHTWSEAWTCHSNGRGKTSCSFASDVSGWATAVFAIGIIPTFGAAFSGIVVFVEVFRTLGRATGGMQLQIDADVAVPEPERPITIDLVVGGNARLDRVEVRLERTANFRSGKRVDTKVHGTVVLFRGGAVITTPAAPAILRGEGVAPARPNPTAIGAESVGQRYVVEYDIGGVASKSMFDLTEPA